MLETFMFNHVSGVLDNVKAQLIYRLAEICEQHKLRCIAF